MLIQGSSQAYQPVVALPVALPPLPGPYQVPRPTWSDRNAGPLKRVSDNQTLFILDWKEISYAWLDVDNYMYMCVYTYVCVYIYIYLCHDITHLHEFEIFKVKSHIISMVRHHLLCGAKWCCFLENQSRSTYRNSWKVLSVLKVRMLVFN